MSPCASVTIYVCLQDFEELAEAAEKRKAPLRGLFTNAERIDEVIHKGRDPVKQWACLEVCESSHAAFDLRKEDSPQTQERKKKSKMSKSDKTQKKKKKRGHPHMMHSEL